METPQNSIKKKIVLGVLFLLPIAIYMFFATGVNNFGKLPVLSQDVVSVSNFKDLNGAPVTLDNKITKQLDVVKVNKLHFVGVKSIFCYLLVNLGFFCLLDLSS